MIIGAGVSGTNAAQIALGTGANVILLDADTERLRYLDQVLRGRLTTLSSNPLNISEAVKRADLLIGAVLIKGAKAPCLVTREKSELLTRASMDSHPSSAFPPSSVSQKAGRRSGDLNTSIARPNRPIAGSLLVLSASLMVAAMGVLVKLASTALPNEVIVFFRNFSSLICFLPWLMLPRNRRQFKTSRFRFHLLRSMAGLGAMYCLFYALAHLQLAEAVLLSFTTPLFIPFIARIWLKEPVSRQTATAILLGFLGVLLILKPGLSVFRPVALVGLASALLAAIAMVTIRRMSNTESAIRIVFYFSCLSTLASAFPLIRVWETPSGYFWPILFATGLVGIIGQLLLTKGYSLAPAAQVGPFTYANVIFSAFIGWWFWNEYLDTWSWMGALLICLTGIISTYRRGGVALPDIRHLPWKYAGEWAQRHSKRNGQ